MSVRSARPPGGRRPARRRLRPGADRGTPERTTSSGAFPVTVGTAFGDVTVEEEPVRVVALGWSDAETALALGVQPVGRQRLAGLRRRGRRPVGRGPATTRRRRSSRRSSPATRRSPPSSPTSSSTPAPPPRRSGTTCSARSRRPIGQPEGVGPYQTTWQQQLELVGARRSGRTTRPRALAGRRSTQAFAEAAAAHPGVRRHRGRRRRVHLRGLRRLRPRRHPGRPSWSSSAS